MKSSCKSIVKTIAILVAPLLLFVILYIPYYLVNSHFIVEWLGCACGKLDEFGNLVESDFNANDFTALFWLFIATCATVLSVFLSKRIPKKLMWLRILYIAGILLASLQIRYVFCQMMMWA